MTDELRLELEELLQRRAAMGDEGRTEAVDRRHAKGRRTAGENVFDLCDEGTFVEYGFLAVAAQRSHRPLKDLIAMTPADETGRREVDEVNRCPHVLARSTSRGKGGHHGRAATRFKEERTALQRKGLAVERRP